MGPAIDPLGPEITLSKVWVAATVKATIEGDVSEIHRSIDDLSADFPSLAERLRTLADNFDYAGINALIAPPSP